MNCRAATKFLPPRKKSVGRISLVAAMTMRERASAHPPFHRFQLPVFSALFAGRATTDVVTGGSMLKFMFAAAL